MYDAPKVGPSKFDLASLKRTRPEQDNDRLSRRAALLMLIVVLLIIGGLALFFVTHY